MSVSNIMLRVKECSSFEAVGHLADRSSPPSITSSSVSEVLNSVSLCSFLAPDLTPTRLRKSSRVQPYTIAFKNPCWVMVTDCRRMCVLNRNTLHSHNWIPGSIRLYNTLSDTMTDGLCQLLGDLVSLLSPGGPNQTSLSDKTG